MIKPPKKKKKRVDRGGASVQNETKFYKEVENDLKKKKAEQKVKK